MLTLPPTTRGNLIALADADDPRQLAVAALRPALVLSASGPGVRILRWSAPGESGSAARLDLEASVQPTAADIDQLKAAGFQVAPMPWESAALRLEGPQLEPVEVDISALSGTIGCASASLTPQAAGVLSALLTRTDSAPLQLTWIGRVLVQLPSVDVVASCAVQEVRRRIIEIQGSRRTEILRSLIDANARIEIRGGTNPELEQALRDWAIGELLQRFERGEDTTVRKSAAEVVSWPLTLAGALDPLPANQRDAVVQTFVLNPEDVSFAPPIALRVLGDFSGTLERVDVQLEPLTDGRPAEAAVTDSEERALSLRTQDFRWRRRIKRKTKPPEDWSDWSVASNAPSLLLAVPDLTALRVEALAPGLDFESRWKSVRIDLDCASECVVLELDASRRAAFATLTPSVTAPAVSAKLTYLSWNGQTIERSVDRVAGCIAVADPFDGHRRRLSVIPSGAGWSEIAGAMIDLRYRDGDQLAQTTLPLTSPNDFAEWEAPARPDGPRTVEWRCHASYRDGRFESTPWASTDESVLAIPLVAPKRRELQILPAFFDPAATPQLDVHIASQDFQQSETFTKKDARNLVAPLGPYRWSASWSFSDGSKRTVPEQVSDEDVLVLPLAPG